MRSDKSDETDKAGKIETALKKSPINYFSDLFIVAMVVGWIAVIAVMLIFAVYSTVAHADNSIWSELQQLVGLPLTYGGAAWMLKNGVQHAIANNRGEQAHMDFARVDVDDDMEVEEPIGNTETEEEEEDDPEG